MERNSSVHKLTSPRRCMFQPAMKFFARPANSYARTKFCVSILPILLASNAEAYGHHVCKSIQQIVVLEVSCVSSCVPLSSKGKREEWLRIAPGWPRNCQIWLRTGDCVECQRTACPPLLVLLARFCHAPLSEASHVIDKYACRAQQSALQCTVKHRLRIRVHPASFRCPSLAFWNVDFPVPRYKNGIQKYSNL